MVGAYRGTSTCFALGGAGGAGGSVGTERMLDAFPGSDSRLREEA